MHDHGPQPLESASEAATNSGSEVPAVVEPAPAEVVAVVDRLVVSAFRFSTGIPRSVGRCHDSSNLSIFVAEIRENSRDESPTQCIQLRIRIVLAALDEDRKGRVRHPCSHFDNLVAAVRSQSGCLCHEVVSMEDKVGRFRVRFHHLIERANRTPQWKRLRHSVRLAIAPTTQLIATPSTGILRDAVHRLLVLAAFSVGVTLPCETGIALAGETAISVEAGIRSVTS